jgi:hypothetical protein
MRARSPLDSTVRELNVNKSIKFVLDDAFKASVPKLCAGRPSYRQAEANDSDAVLGQG